VKGNISLKKIVILDNIRSVYNVGSIFRTSDALGVDMIYLCGVTPTPTDRFGRARQDLAKVALGAEKDVAWEHVKNTADIIKKLKKEGFQIIAVEQDKKSVAYNKIKTKNEVAIVMGTEVTGIDKKTLALCDVIAEIPMKGNKESLNVSVSFGIAGYEIFG
jgi:23S rRNA (guanosine2251-2'-O)-methyltransferase